VPEMVTGPVKPLSTKSDDSSKFVLALSTSPLKKSISESIRVILSVLAVILPDKTIEELELRRLNLDSRAANELPTRLLKVIFLEALVDVSII
jgi:hypothetical protein